jgi:LacI family transcriptional regulator
MAAGVIHAAHSRGIRVPDQLSIVGFEDTAIAAHIWPPLTTVRWPITTMARAAAQKLVVGEERADEGQSLFLSTLIRRASVAPPGGR